MTDTALAGLLHLQDIDLHTDQLSHRRRHLPERDALAGLDGRIADLRARQESVASTRADVHARQAEADAELSATEKRVVLVTERTYSGEVTASRDLQAMAAELDQLRARASTLEDAVLALMEEREPVDAEAEAVTADLATAGEERAGAVAELTRAEADVDAELAELAARRLEAAGAVPADLLAYYEKLRGRLGGIGVARLVGNHCDGCHLTLSAAELDRVRHARSGEIATCEQCSRILVPT